MLDLRKPFGFSPQESASFPKLRAESSPLDIPETSGVVLSWCDIISGGPGPPRPEKYESVNWDDYFQY